MTGDLGTESTGFGPAQHGPDLVDLGYLSLPEEVQKAAEAGLRQASAAGIPQAAIDAGVAAISEVRSASPEAGTRIILEAAAPHFARALAEQRALNAHALARLQELERAVLWETSCTNCAGLLDSLARWTPRAEEAERRLAELEGSVIPDLLTVAAAIARECIVTGRWDRATQDAAGRLAAVAGISGEGAGLEPLAPGTPWTQYAATWCPLEEPGKPCIEVRDDEEDARQFASYFAGGYVVCRTVASGPWERVPGAGPEPAADGAEGHTETSAGIGECPRTPEGVQDGSGPREQAQP
jgi:hypothetical protein